MKPRVAVLGCGSWGKNLVRVLDKLGALAAIHDPDAEAATAMRDAHDVEIRSLPAILSDDSVDCVAIAAPAVHHARLTAEALRAGKHVFVEKPFTLDVAEAELCCDEAARRDRVLMVGHVLQYHPVFVTLGDLVRAGRLGRLVFLYSNRLSFGRSQPEESIFWSLATHDVSMILALVRTEPDIVEAVGSCAFAYGGADVATMHLRFPQGPQAHVFVSRVHPFKEQRLVVIGDACMAVFDDREPWSSKLRLYPHRAEWQDGRLTPIWGTAESIAVEDTEPLEHECRHFLECVTTGAAPRTDGREALRVLNVLQRAELAMSTRRIVGGNDGRQRRRPAGTMIHESAYVDDPCEIGEGTQVWHFSHVLEGCRIGRDCHIGQNVMIGRNVSIGDGCRIQNNVSLYEGVTLDDNVFCGPSCVFTNDLNPRAGIDHRDEWRPTRVARGATIGANATIVCGNDIGEYAFVAAGTVVTHDVPAFALVAGVPGCRVGWVSHAAERLGPDLVCPRTGRRYREVGADRLVEI